MARAHDSPPHIPHPNPNPIPHTLAAPTPHIELRCHAAMRRGYEAYAYPCTVLGSLIPKRWFSIIIVECFALRSVSNW